jgi:hypothetical protein
VTEGAGILLRALRVGLLLAALASLALASSGLPERALSAPGGVNACKKAKQKAKKHGKPGQKGAIKRACRRPAPAAAEQAPAPEYAFSANGLFPAFDPDVSDYAIRCPGDEMLVSGRAGDGTSVSIGGGPALSTDFSLTVPITPGQGLTITATRGPRVASHHVRCLPADFPGWDFQRFAQPDNDFYVVSPTRRLPPGAQPYVVVFDDNGVPVWWYAAQTSLSDAKALSDGTIAYGRTNETAYELRRADGSLARTASFVGSPTDSHDMQEVGNGNLLVMSYKTRAEPVDLTAYGGSATATVRDAAVQEIDEDGDVVWSWNSKDHLALDQTANSWWNNTATAPSPDIVHLNSLELAGDSLVVSLRKTDAVYSVSRATGEVEWKLGGTPHPKRLTVLDDPHGDYPLAGQHDARILPDGTLTVHDNATNAGRPPRAVRYAIDEEAGTATLLESIEDPDVSSTGCCGGARRSPSGSWVISWGQVPIVTEFDAAGNRVFLLRFGGEVFSYRANPVPSGRLDIHELRVGMDSMFAASGP